jgi:beta propeller repeat protein
MKFHRLTGIGVCIALFFGSVLEGRAQETRLTCITSGTGHKDVPKIYGDKIVWTDRRNDEAAIYMYDLSTKTESKIPVSKGSHTSQLDIYENRIVWSRGIWDAIMVYDLDTKTETEIVTRAKTPGHKSNPAIYGDKVVWEDYRDGGSQIYMYDMASETETLISAIDHDPEQVNNGGDPDIYNNKIVWKSMSPDTGLDIYMYDLGPDGIKDTSDDGGERQITNAQGAQAAPKIYGDVIVWMDDRNDEDEGDNRNNLDIYVYDLSTQEEAQITSDPNFQGNPDIYGDIIIWIDSGNGCCDVYARDLNTEQEIAIAPDVRGQHIAIYKDAVVMGNAGRLIFVAKIPVSTRPHK